MQRGERGRHTQSGRTNRMLRLTTRRLLYRTIATIWISYHGLYASLFLSLSLFLSSPSLSFFLDSSCIHALSLSCLYLSYISLSLVPLSFLSPSFFLALPLHTATATPRHPSTTLSRSHVHLSFLYLSFCLSYSLYSPFSFFVYPARRIIAVSLAPPSNRRSTGRFCI